jgi:hypothetical protein
MERRRSRHNGSNDQPVGEANCHICGDGDDCNQSASVLQRASRVGDKLLFKHFKGQGMRTSLGMDPGVPGQVRSVILPRINEPPISCKATLASAKSAARNCEAEQRSGDLPK